MVEEAQGSKLLFKMLINAVFVPLIIPSAILTFAGYVLSDAGFAAH
jgi:hypothetical protein